MLKKIFKQIYICFKDNILNLFYIKEFFVLVVYKLKKEKTIIINSASGLGDFIWERNIFKIIRNISFYSNYKIIVLCTKRWKNFAYNIDRNNVDLFVFIRDPFSTPQILLIILRLFKFDIFVDWRTPNSYWKNITKNINATFVYNRENIHLDLNNFYDTNFKLFTRQFIDIPKNFKFELDYLNLKPKNFNKNNYSILTLGGFSQGMFSINQIVFIITKIINLLKTKVLVLGLKKDIKFFSKVLNMLKQENITTAMVGGVKEYIINGVGKYTESELPYLVDNAKYVITTNTGIWHISILLNKKILCICKDEKWIYNCPPGTNFVVTKTKISDITFKEIEEGVIKLVRINNK